MALNQPEIEVEDIIEDRIYELVDKLRKMKYKIDRKDIEYELFRRCEYIGIRSSTIYPNEDLPRLFGVQRGYNGGGIHGDLACTEIYKMTTRRQDKARKALGLFEECFTSIMNDIDEAQGGEVWERVSL